MMVPISPYAPQHLLLLALFITAILVSVQEHLVVILIYIPPVINNGEHFIYVL